MPILLRDYETRSTLNLKKFGAWRYATHLKTDVLCCAYCVDDDPVKLWVPGDPIPTEWIEAAQNPDWIVSAFNDNFERQIEAHIMGPRYGWPIIPIERHRCLQASTLALALPPSLEKVAAALGLETQKDNAGKRNMLTLSRPRKPRPCEAPEEVYWNDDPARFELLYSYCKQDVETERALHARVGFLSQEEQRVWELDATINNRGIFVDDALALGAIKIDKAAHAAIDAELQLITSNEVMTVGQTEKISAWLAAHDCLVDNIQKETLAHALTRKNIPPETRRVLELRRDGAHAAAGKFATMMDWRAEDGRVRGCFRYHGASTGRWTSIGLQLQNLKRPDIADMAAAIDAVRTGDLDHLKKLHPKNPLAIVGDVARGALIAAPGHKLITADFSGIEARVLAWLAGEQSKIAQWAKFDETGIPEDEPYFITGAAMGLGRDDGKTATLAFGFMGGKGAFRKLAPDSTATDDDIKRYQTTWRNNHPMACKFWDDLNRAAIEAVRSPGRVFVVNARISFLCDETFLRMHLPSGRELAYPLPRLMTNERDDLIIVYKDASSGKWADCKHHGKLGSWPGGWTENAVSGTARDVFAAAMPHLEAAGYPIVLHVHDEIVAEVPEDFGGVDEFKRIITAVPAWASGLPIAAKGDARERFCKIGAAAGSSNTHDALPVVDPVPQDITWNGSCEHKNTNEDTNNIMDYTMYNRDGYPIGNGEDHESGSFGPSFIYKDAAGQPFLRKTRRINAKGKKEFPQQHWENGRWAWGKPKGPDIPYRLPELIAAPPEEPVFICEGEKDADSVAALGFVATTNSGGATEGKWTPGLNAHFLDRKTVYILEDNDETGRGHVSRVASNLRGIVPEIRVINFRDLPENGDVSDWLGQGHTKEELLEKAKVGPVPEPRFKFVAFDDITLNTTPAYLVKDVLPRIGLTVIWGPPKCGKSFFAYNLTMHVALGWKFRGLKVRQGTVAYCALEGGEAFRNRKEAFRRKKLEDYTGGPVPFHLMAMALSLVADHQELIASIKEQCGIPAVIVIDTLNRSLAGSESSDEDMGNYVKAADALRDAFGCAVILVHHCGYEGSRPRGHSSLPGAVDAQIGVLRDEANNIVATVEYLKDGKDGPEGTKLTSRLEVVDLGLDDDGDPISSCVVAAVEVEPETEAPREKRKAPKGNAKIAHEALFETIGAKGVIPPADPNIPAWRKCARIPEWKLQSIKKGICNSGDWKSRERSFSRASEALIAEGLVGVWEDYAWINTI